MHYKTKRVGNVSVVTISHRGSFEQDFLITSDRHWDNPRSLQDLQKAHLIEAIERDAGVIDLGDFFCAMQGRFDKRASKQGVRPEHQVDDYLDALVTTGIDFFAPYARQFIRIGYGNHETSVLKRTETDLIRRLVEGLNQRTGSDIHIGGYTGYIQFLFKGPDGVMDRRNAWYTHGSGGGGSVTKGVIAASRRAMYLPDAHLCFSGHVHEEWVFPITRSRLRDDGSHYLDEQTHIQIPTYKDEYDDGSAGWHIERGGPPKPLGGVWLTFKKSKRSDVIETVVTRAK